MSYAEVLESYMIAEEGLFDRFKRTTNPVQKDPGVKVDRKMKEIFTRIGFASNRPVIHYMSLAELIEVAVSPDKITSQDMKYLHSKMYTKEDAEAFFAPTESEEFEYIEKYEPLPVYANGMGDFLCYLKNGRIEEYIHDTTPSFGSTMGAKYSSIEKAVQAKM